MSLEFVDTNILLYAYDITAGPRHDQAFALVDRLGRQRKGALSVQVLQEFYVNVTRKIAVVISPQVAIERLRLFSRWPVYSPLAHDVAAAAELAERSQLSFWDAMIVHSAAQLGCNTLWTEDLNAGQIIAGVEIRNPFGNDLSALEETLSVLSNPAALADIREADAAYAKGDGLRGVQALRDSHREAS